MTTRLACWTTVAVLVCLHCLGQQLSIPNSSDHDIAAPHYSGHSAGYSDPAAQAELLANVQASRLDIWRGMKATGSIIEVGFPDAVPATYEMLPNGRARLEIQHANGDYARVVNGLQGHVIGPRAKPLALSLESVAGGIAPLDIAQTVIASENQFSIVDGGMMPVGGKMLHRVTVERSILPNPIQADPANKSHSVIDCYFDPQTHLLAKTAMVVLLPAAGSQRFLRTISYTNYKVVGQMMVPSSMSETLNGQPTWSLSLETIDIENLPTTNHF
jgi:hypothetical protein